jgi:hypothetical protein
MAQATSPSQSTLKNLPPEFYHHRFLKYDDSTVLVVQLSLPGRDLSQESRSNLMAANDGCAIFC